MRWWQQTLLIIPGIFLLLQLIPYGKNHTNSEVLREPIWDSLETESYFKSSCADCHSNQTLWPWYAYIAPTSWLIRRHVDEGRHELNLSALGYQENNIADMAKSIWDGTMPPRSYLLLHPEAALSTEDKGVLSRGLERTFANPQNYRFSEAD